MRTRRIAILAWICAVGCTESTTPHDCDGGQSDIVCSLSATPAVHSSTDGGTVYTVTIDAVIPNLKGGTKASVTPSSGTAGGAMPGAAATVVLSPLPMAASGSGQVEGSVEWSVPPMRAARLDVTVEEAATTVTVNSP